MRICTYSAVERKSHNSTNFGIERDNYGNASLLTLFHGVPMVKMSSAKSGCTAFNFCQILRWSSQVNDCILQFSLTNHCSTRVDYTSLSVISL